MSDFEVHPIGTGKLIDEQKKNKKLQAALEEIASVHDGFHALPSGKYLTERAREALGDVGAGVSDWAPGERSPEQAIYLERKRADDKDKEIEKLQAVVDANQDREILRAFFEAVCDDNWEVANGIRAALMPVAALKEGE